MSHSAISDSFAYIIVQYPTTNHFHPSVDQYGYPMMNNRLPNQNPQSMDQSQRGSNQRRHTVNNVLSTISIQQQQNLQRVYQQNHIGNENPSPRHSPVNHQINHHHESSQPSSNHMVIQQSQVQQQQQENSLISLRLVKLTKKKFKYDYGSCENILNSKST